MRIKDLLNEEYEFEEVTIRENSKSETWEMAHKGKIIYDNYKTKEEANLWGMKISKNVYYN